MDIDGNFVPAGCNVGVPIYAIHHHSELYGKPFDYIPERWLEDMTPEAQTAFNPFSMGPRSCIGRSLALRETQYVLARVLAMFELERTTPAETEFKLKEHVTSSQNGPFIRFSYRK
ncbi:Cytochrome P450 [Macrophomina phaseolina MS6]|uniref:Cytochrome P450 n=1 Tax=Macrophomina phaseolina (strain MS6) TaxID=1126212 RepID=K2RB49_MACPH|nr:Cytochrome P450 [Macrophomina phaseolina MS6]